MKVGAWYKPGGKTDFVLWSPYNKEIKLKIKKPFEKIIPLNRTERGYLFANVEELPPGAEYSYLVDGDERPDPASQYQPGGVHEASAVVDHYSFGWEDDTWKNLPLEDYIMYELHTGTFTDRSTFDGIIEKLDYLKELGINAIELMPVAQFPGERNWGYDGAHPFAVQNSYGGPEGLKRLVNAAHVKGIAVVLDVVYNHLGPEGNYLSEFAPYFTGKYNTPWGNALNFDDAYSDEVRNYFIQNATYWFEHFHIDALRLDAIHAIFDNSAYPFLRELSDTVNNFAAAKGRPFYLIAESGLNDAKVINNATPGDFNMHSQWSDDFHHIVHVLLTGEKNGYYEDYHGVEQLEKFFREGQIYTGEYSQFRKRRFGNSTATQPSIKFTVCTQNHDQTGNRMLGERLATLVSFEAQKLAAGINLLSPFLPLLFMGEEYGENNPFQYFVHHNDPNLVEAVRKGRKREFKEFRWKGEVPDPQDTETFNRSMPDWEKTSQGKHATLLSLYRKLIELRNEMKPVNLPKEKIVPASQADLKLFSLLLDNGENKKLVIFNFNIKKIKVKLTHIQGKWRNLMDSSATVWDGPGNLVPDIVEDINVLEMNALSFVLLEKILRNE